MPESRTPNLFQANVICMYQALHDYDEATIDRKVAYAGMRASKFIYSIFCQSMHVSVCQLARFSVKVLLRL